MPFSFEAILERFRFCQKKKEVGHAYLITAPQESQAENIAKTMAEVILGSAPDSHPDFYCLRPESKLRRITVQQIRTLEHSLYLKPSQAPQKVALILGADRMCLGQAEAANAFLKTLEEPPEATLLFLVSSHPSRMLPTLLSRCLRLDLLAPASSSTTSAPPDWLQAWFTSPLTGALRAHQRATLLQERWRHLQTNLETSCQEAADEALEKEALQAIVAGEIQLARAEAIAQLQHTYWEQAKKQLEDPQSPKLSLAIRPILALEELHHALQLNIHPDLALERACFAIEGLL